jgi:hypothetical protein
MPVLAALHPLPPATRGQLLQLWQAMVSLVHGHATATPRSETALDGAEASATTLVY